MGSTFIALPLTSGEAFLLRTDDEDGRERTILVDGGKKYGEGSRELAKLLADIAPKIDHIDIAVCTHSDADHSQGFWFFADDWYDTGRTIGEYWLPGRWANAMPAILTDPSGFASQLFAGARQAAVQIGSYRPDPESGDLLRKVSRESRYRQLEEMLDDESPDNPASAVRVAKSEEMDAASAFGLTSEELAALRVDVQETDDVIDPLMATLQMHRDGSIIMTPRWFDDWEPELDPLNLETRAAFLEVAETAHAIRRIACAAVERKIRVRWFDFGEFARRGKAGGGFPGLLEPAASVEVVPDRAKALRLSALALFNNLRLSRQNVESLVFYRPETALEPAVLFLGDSRLAHGIERPEKDFKIPFVAPTRKLLVTAPHHGSDHNDRAYAVIKGWLGGEPPYFVRNGGQSNQQLGDYLLQDDRRCAQCVQCNGKAWNQRVSVTSSGSDWEWPPNAKACGTPRF